MRDQNRTEQTRISEKIRREGFSIAIEFLSKSDTRNTGHTVSCILDFR
jgi:hypothetical protein